MGLGLGENADRHGQSFIQQASYECQPGARHWLWEAVGQDGGWMWGWMFSVLASRYRVFLTSRAPLVLLLPVPSTVTTWPYCAACFALCPGV